MRHKITEQSYTNTVIRLLEKLIEEYAPNCRFSLHGYIDDGVCMERTDDGWMVYTGSRGNKDAAEDFADIKDACVEVIKRITDNYATEIILTEKFKAGIKALRTRYLAQGKQNNYSGFQITMRKQDGTMKRDGIGVVRYAARLGETPGVKSGKGKKSKANKGERVKVDG